MDGANVGIIDNGVAEHREEGKFPDMVEKGGAVEEPKVYDKDFMQKTRYKVSLGLRLAIRPHKRPRHGVMG
jgi:hypothetical protein